MRGFWDERAREDAFHFVDSREPYRAADPDRFWRRGAEDLETLLATVEAPPIGSEDHVLDLGCGLGRLTRALAARAGRVTAVDVSAEMLERARELNPGLDHVTWLLGDGETLDGVADASVDVAVSHVVLQHIPSAKVQLGYVEELRRVLRPGGWAVFGVSTDPRIHEPRVDRRSALRSLVGATPKGRDRPEWLGAFVPLDALGATALQAGLDLPRIEGANTQFTIVLAEKR